MREAGMEIHFIATRLHISDEAEDRNSEIYNGIGITWP